MGGSHDGESVSYNVRYFTSLAAVPPHCSTFLGPSSLTMQTIDSPSSTATYQPLQIGHRQFQSRLMTGTGKYDDFETMRQSIAASGCEIVTVAVRRVQTNAPGHQGLAEAVDWAKVWMLPNTAGCQTADEAVRVARLGREWLSYWGKKTITLSS